MDRWPALESNAEVMSGFLQTLQQDDAEATAAAPAPAAFSFADVFSLDEECLAFVPQPVHALVLAYASDAIKDTGHGSDGSATTITTTSSSSGSGNSLVFIRQLPALDAACGTIALLHAAANAPHVRAATPPSSLLGRFLAAAGGDGGDSSSSGGTAEAWGERLDADDGIRAAHQ